MGQLIYLHCINLADCRTHPGYWPSEATFQDGNLPSHNMALEVKSTICNMFNLNDLQKERDFATDAKLSNLCRLQSHKQNLDMDIWPIKPNM